MMPSTSVALQTQESQRVLLAGDAPAELAAGVTRWAAAHGFAIGATSLPLERRLLRQSIPAMILLGVGQDTKPAQNTIASLKADGRLQTVPIVVLTAAPSGADWLEHGADEVLCTVTPECERGPRLTAALRRTRRDIQVNPSTRLAGADALAAAMQSRIANGDLFGACYADLDHFKEFNDRYGYAQGDDVIRGVAELLVEVVEAAAGDRGFVGHIGGDDFLLLVPLECVSAACDLLVQRADEILPARYSAHDRQAGYFFGKDRRGRLDRVPLMTLSIGVVTNARRRFTSAAQVSELATEMKTYAKTLPGSVWAMD